jgi:uncharacterized protein YndB with AHSA1/START domain
MIRLLGTLGALDGKGVVRMQDRFDTGIDDLWAALTEPRRLARWIADVEGDLRLGGEFHALFTSQAEATGRVEVCEPPRHLQVVTVGTGDANEHVIEATLTADGDETVLVIEVRGVPLTQVAGYGSGWQVHIEDLGAFLAGRERCDIKARWDELMPAYEHQAAHPHVGL